MAVRSGKRPAVSARARGMGLVAPAGGSLRLLQRAERASDIGAVHGQGQVGEFIALAQAGLVEVAPPTGGFPAGRADVGVLPAVHSSPIPGWGPCMTAARPGRQASQPRGVGSDHE